MQYNNYTCRRCTNGTSFSLLLQHVNAQCTHDHDVPQHIAKLYMPVTTLYICTRSSAQVGDTLD
jgi:hypothetical protein